MKKTISDFLIFSASFLLLKASEKAAKSQSATFRSSKGGRSSVFSACGWTSWMWNPCLIYHKLVTARCSQIISHLPSVGVYSCSPVHLFRLWRPTLALSSCASLRLPPNFSPVRLFFCSTGAIASPPKLRAKDCCTMGGMGSILAPKWRPALCPARSKPVRNPNGPQTRRELQHEVQDWSHATGGNLRRACNFQMTCQETLRLLYISALYLVH